MSKDVIFKYFYCQINKQWNKEKSSEMWVYYAEKKIKWFTSISTPNTPKGFFLYATYLSYKLEKLLKKRR